MYGHTYVCGRRYRWESAAIIVGRAQVNHTCDSYCINRRATRPNHLSPDSSTWGATVTRLLPTITSSPFILALPSGNRKHRYLSVHTHRKSASRCRADSQALVGQIVKHWPAVSKKAIWCFIL
nr:hypothetical protein CFP56_37122 [Quercus suber]